MIKPTENLPLLVSFSGGESSGLMLRLIQLHQGLENTFVIFANTGKENPETLDFIHKIETTWDIPIVWIEGYTPFEKGHGTTYRIVDYYTASRNGEPFEQLIKKYGLPSRMNRMCTGNLKIKIIEKYMRGHVGIRKWTTAVGIRADEPQRIKDKYYLLAEFGITKHSVNEFWSKQPFRLDLPKYAGNCDLCHLKSLSKRIQCIQRKPEIADWWQRMEELVGDQFDNDASVLEIKRLALEKQAQIQINFESVDMPCACAD
jgi:hypothetical protein